MSTLSHIFSSFFSVLYEEAATGGVLLKQILLKISQNLQEGTYSGVSYFNQVPGVRPTTL